MALIKKFFISLQTGYDFLNYMNQNTLKNYIWN